MQCDPAFARRLLAGGEAALMAEGLVGRPAEFLLAADPGRLVADPGDRRRRQTLSNLSAEFEIAARVLAEGPAGPAVPAEFFSSPEFHDAVRDDGLLPTAFGAYLARRARETSDFLAAAVRTLEAALAAARRRPCEPRVRTAGVGAAGDALAQARGARLSPGARLVVLPQGTLDAYDAAKAAAGDGGAPLRTHFAGISPAAGAETALVLGLPRASEFRPAAVRAERLEPAVAALLRAASDGLDPEAFARAHDLAAEDVAEFVAELVAEGVLAPRA
jgi:hypothetical protein